MCREAAEEVSICMCVCVSVSMTQPFTQILYELFSSVCLCTDASEDAAPRGSGMWWRVKTLFTPLSNSKTAFTTPGVCAHGHFASIYKCCCSQFMSVFCRFSWRFLFEHPETLRQNDRKPLCHPGVTSDKLKIVLQLAATSEHLSRRLRPICDPGIFE